MPLPITPAQLDRLRRRVRESRRGVPKIGRGIEPPRSVEASYYRALRGIVRELQNQVMTQLVPLLSTVENEYLDSPGSVKWYLNGVISSIEQVPVVAEQTQARIAKRMATSTESFNRNLFIREINQAIGVSMREVKKMGSIFTSSRASKTTLG